MENDHLVRSSLDAQIKEAKSRAEQFSKSLQDAREQEAIALRLLEQERERWTHSFEEKSILIEQLERELTSTVEALDVERSTDKFSRSNFARTGNTNATNTIHETTKLNNLPRSSDIREINYNEMNKSMHDIISDVNNYQPNQADVRLMNGTSNHHNYRDQHFQYNPNPASTLSSMDPLYYNTTNQFSNTGYSRQSTHTTPQQLQQQPLQLQQLHQPQQQTQPTVSHSYHVPPILPTTTTASSLPTNPPPPPAALTQSEDVTVWRDLLAQYQQQLKTTKTELLTCTEQRDHYSQQNELLNKEVKQLLEEKELFATACENAEGKLKFRVSQIMQYEEEKDTLSQRITELTALNSELQRAQDNMRHDLEVTRAELHIVTQRAQIVKHSPDWKYTDSIHPDEADKILKPCVSTATQCNSSDGSEVQHGATATAASARRATQATEAYIKDLHRQLEETHTSYEGQLEEVRHQVAKLQQRVRSAEQQVEQSHQQYLSAEETQERYRVERDALLTMVSKLHLNASAGHPPHSSARDYRSSYSAGAVSSRSHDHHPQQQQFRDTNAHGVYTHSGESTTRQQHQKDQRHHAHSTSRSDHNELRADHLPEQRIHQRSTAHQSHHPAPSTHLTTASTLAVPVQETSSTQEHTHSQLRNRTPEVAADAQRPGPSTGAPVRGAVATHSSLPAPSGALTAAVETQQNPLPRSLPHTAASTHRSTSALSHNNNIEYHSEDSSSNSSSNSGSDSEEEESECDSDEGSSEEDVAASHQGHRTDTTALVTSTSNVLNMSDGPHAEAHNPVQALAARQAHIASMLTSSNPTPATQLTKKSTTKASTTHKKSKKAQTPIRGTPPSSKQPTGTLKSADRSPASMVIRQPPSYTGASNDRFVRGGVEHIHTLKGHKTSTAKNKSLTSKTTGSSNKQARTAKPSSSSDKQKKASTANKDSTPKAAALDNSSTNVATATAAVNQLYIPASFSNPADISWVSETAVAPTTTAVGAVPSTTSTGTAPVGWKKDHVPLHHQYEEIHRGLYETDENALDAAGLHLTSREHLHSYAGRQSDADERSESLRSSEEVGEGEEHSEEESEEGGDVDSLSEEQEVEGVYGTLGRDENLLQSAQHQQHRPVQEHRGDDHHFVHPAGLAPHPHVLPDGEDEDSDALNHCMVVQRVPDRKVLGGINFHDLSHAHDHPAATVTTTVPPSTTATATSQDVYVPSTASVASDLSSTHLSADDYQGRPRHSQFTGVTDIKISRKSQPDVDLTRSASTGGTGGGSVRSSVEKLSSKSKPATAAVLRTGTGRGNSRARTPSPMLRSTTGTTTSTGKATGSTGVTRGSKHYTPTSYSTRRSSSNGHNSGVAVVTPSTSTLRTTGSSSLTGKLLSGKSKGSTNMHSTSTGKAKSNGASRQRTLLF